MAEAWREAGNASIAVRCVDANECDSQALLCRSRLAGKESQACVRPDIYAATPPGECLRLTLSLLASGRCQSTGLTYANVSRTHLYAPVVCPVYVRLLEEHKESEDVGMCGRLRISMYATTDTALNWVCRSWCTATSLLESVPTSISVS